jgi:hypothetical protein
MFPQNIPAQDIATSPEAVLDGVVNADTTFEGPNISHLRERYRCVRMADRDEVLSLLAARGVLDDKQVFQTTLSSHAEELRTNAQQRRRPQSDQNAELVELYRSSRIEAIETMAAELKKNDSTRLSKRIGHFMSSMPLIYVTLVASFTDSHNTHGGGTFFSTSFSYGGDGYVAPVSIGYEGGNVTVTYQIGSQSAPVQTMNFQILGNSPGVQQVDSFSQQQDPPWYWSQLLQQESTYHQYAANGNPYVTPNPDGIGLTQTDGARSDVADSVYWDWPSKIISGLDLDSANSVTALKWWNKYLAEWAKDYPCLTNGPVSSNKGNGCFFAYPVAQNPGAHVYSDANRITGYNGVGGNGIYPPHYYIYYTPSTAAKQGAWTVQQGVKTYVQDVCSRPPI